jgi:hypothetical protein
MAALRACRALFEIFLSTFLLRHRCSKSRLPAQAEGTIFSLWKLTCSTSYAVEHLHSHSATWQLKRRPARLELRAKLKSLSLTFS